MRLPSKQTLLWLAIPLAFVLLVVLFYPFRYRIEFDTDEGVNAIKAMMVLRGYDLYREIWSDQPPLFTYLLAAWFSALGLRLTAGRLLVLLLSAGLIGLAAAYLRRNWSLLAAAIAGLLLALLPFYLRLSVSMMIGLPAIALAMASFYALAEWHARPSHLRLAASALLLGLSILTKAITAVLAPIWLIGIVIAAARDPRLRSGGGSRWIPPAIWVAVLGAVTGAALLLIVGPENLDQLFNVHLEAARSLDLEPLRGRRTLASYLSESWPLFVLAAIGAVQAVRSRKWTALYLAGWVVAGYALLRFTGPTWYHHQLLVTVPAAILASIAIATGVEDLRSRSLRGAGATRFALSLISLVLALFFLAERSPGTVEGLDARLPNLNGIPPAEEGQERALLAAMGDHASEAHWLYTDRPIFAFLTQLPVPPNLAVITQKRLLTEDLTDAEIAETLEAYAPEMILNARFVLPVVSEYMRSRNFSRIDETLKYRLYLQRNPP